LLLALLGFVALVDVLLGGISGLAKDWFQWNLELSLRVIAGYVFYPFTLVIGVPLSDAATISEIIGERIVVTEVQSYQDLASAIAAGKLQHPRSAVVAAYALCGFAHFASLAIFVGGVSAIAPSRTKDLAAVGLRALLAASLATLLTGAVAGTVYTGATLIGLSE
jgi:CNT family concentrative nucleoside transporter